MKKEGKALLDKINLATNKNNINNTALMISNIIIKLKSININSKSPLFHNKRINILTVNTINNKIYLTPTKISIKTLIVFA